MSSFRFLFASVDSPPKIGGVSLLAEQLSLSLAEHYGKEAVYVGPQGTYFEDPNVAMKLYEDFQSDTRLRSGPFSPREDERIEDLFDKIIQGYSLDCMILWHPFYYGMGGIAAARKNGIPVSVFVHGTELTSQISVGNDRQSVFEPNPTSNDLDQRLYHTLVEADQILTNSTYTASLIEQVVPDAFISVVGCGISEDELNRQKRFISEYNLFDKAAARETVRLPERKTLAHVGRLVPHKNQKLSIELVAASSDLQLVIIGDGPNREDLEAHARELNVSDRVFFVGSISESDKWKYLRASDAGLMISDFDDHTGGYEGFGIAMLEYAAAACVVVSTGEYGMYDFIKRYNAGILSFNDERSIAEHAAELEQKLNDLEFLQNQVNHAREITNKRFTWRHVADRVVTSLTE